MVPPLLVRADAGADIGLGHVLRTLALAQAWRRRGGDVVYASASLPDDLRARIERAGAHVEPLPARHPDPRDANALAQLLARPWEWVVVDGYHLDAAYRRRIRAAGRRVLVIGDAANQELGAADAILNQNAGAEIDLPTVDPRALLLLGSRYVLLREEFRAAPRRWRDGEARRVLVTFGGGDDEGASERALSALALLPADRLQVRVLAGPANPNAVRLVEVAAGTPFACEVVAGDDLPALFDWADVALTASGSSCWELSALGVPMVAVQTADNQAVVQRGLAAAGAAVALGPLASVADEAIAEAVGSLLADAGRRRRLAEAATDLVDGRGADRVVNALLGAAV